ncbi:hypothetical protein C8R44DRAFT_991381 [Mycena epipterygia]|nr:hypothetical protein C8R44DRAFT_991381 [Mycena epipterygia]
MSFGQPGRAMLRSTPNLKKFTLAFSGHLYTYEDCLGQPLMDALCTLTHLEEFTHMAMSTRQTDIGLYNILRLASSCPKLCVLYVSGDLQCAKDVSGLPPVTCALQHVTLEACTANLDDVARLFAGSANSIKTLELWASAPAGKLDTILLPILPALESLKVGGTTHPTSSFARERLGTAPRLHTLQLGGDADRSGRLRVALVAALTSTYTSTSAPSAAFQSAASESTAGRTCTQQRTKPLFPALKRLGYPALVRLGKENSREWDNIGEADLRAAAAARGIAVARAPDLVYKETGQGRREKMAQRHANRDK